MTADADAPTRDDKFSFGIAAAGWQGVDVSGGAVRPPMPADRAVRELAALGAYGVNFRRPRPRLRAPRPARPGAPVRHPLTGRALEESFRFRW